jgi:predicted nucleic acid-binding protein
VSGFVIDASVALAWCFDDEATDATRALLDRFADEQAAVPSLWHLELANALAVSERNQRITRADSSEFIALIGQTADRRRRNNTQLGLEDGARPGSE